MPICANTGPVVKPDLFSTGAKICCLRKGKTADQWGIGQQAGEQAGVQVYRRVEVSC